MSPLVWLILAAAVALAPLPSVAAGRVATLGRLGRLIPAVPTRASRRPPRLRARTAGLLCCAAGALAAGVLGGVALGVAAAVVAATVTTLVCAALARRRDWRRRRSLLAAVRLLVVELEAGSRPDAALQAAASSVAGVPQYAQVFTAAASAATLGGDVDEVFLTSGCGALGPLGHAWRLGSLTGAPMADVLARVAGDLSEHERQQQAVAVALAGPRSSAAMLAGLPVLGIALGGAMGARPLSFLFGAPGGRLLCCVGVLLDAAGVLWTQRLMQRAQRE